MPQVCLAPVLAIGALAVVEPAPYQARRAQELLRAASEHLQALIHPGSSTIVITIIIIIIIIIIITIIIVIIIIIMHNIILLYIYSTITINISYNYYNNFIIIIIIIHNCAKALFSLIIQIHNSIF